MSFSTDKSGREIFTIRNIGPMARPPQANSAKATSPISGTHRLAMETGAVKLSVR